MSSLFSIGYNSLSLIAEASSEKAAPKEKGSEKEQTASKEASKPKNKPKAKEKENKAEEKPEAEAKASAAGKSQEAASDVTEGGTSEEKEAEAEVESESEIGLTEAEKQLLQSLRNRRLELDQKERDIETNNQIFKAMEESIGKKINNLKGLQDELQAPVTKYEDTQNANIGSLVKIYEAMKPKDAAKIFNTLHSKTLFEVAKFMKEEKLAPILAAMNPEKAKELTISLANQFKITDEVRNPALPFKEPIN